MVLVTLVIKYEVVLEIIITIVSVLPGYCTAIGKKPSVVSLVHEISKLSTLSEGENWSVQRL